MLKLKLNLAINVLFCSLLHLFGWMDGWTVEVIIMLSQLLDVAAVEAEDELGNISVP